MIVEDNTSVRELLQRVLRGAGYQVLVAAHPSEARALCDKTKQKIDLLLTDVVMPETSGPVLADELRASRPNLAVVLMSDLFEPDGYLAALRARGYEVVEPD